MIASPQAGACFGEAFGWERANWYAPAGVEPAHTSTVTAGRTGSSTAPANIAPCAAPWACSINPRSPSSASRDADAARVLNRVCANDVDVAAGKMVYTQWLNERGGIEADLTVTRLSETAYLIVTGAETETKEFNWLNVTSIAGKHCVLTNVTSGMGVLSVMGPRARELLQSLTPDDLSDAAFPFATSQEIELGYALVRASRITYVGELGWELYVPTEFMAGVYDEIVAAGAAHRSRARGLPRPQLAAHRKGVPPLRPRHHRRGHAVGGGPRLRGEARKTGRIHRTRGAAASARDRHCQAAGAIPATLARAPALSQRAYLARRLRIVGFIRSGMYAHTLGAAVGLGYVTDVAGGIDADAYEIEVAGVRHAALASLRPLYDPKQERIRR